MSYFLLCKAYNGLLGGEILSQHILRFEIKYPGCCSPRQWVTPFTEQSLLFFFSLQWNGPRSNTLGNASVWISLNLLLQARKVPRMEVLAHDKINESVSKWPSICKSYLTDQFLTNLFITGDCHLFSICILIAVEEKQNKTNLSAICLRQKITLLCMADKQH